MCLLISDVSDVVTEGVVACISLLIFQVLLDCGSIYAFQVVFDVYKFDVFGCFHVCGMVYQ